MHIIVKKGKRVGWNDLRDGHQDDLRRIYKLNDRGMENAVRDHMDGANATERRELYQSVYGKRK